MSSVPPVEIPVTLAVAGLSAAEVAERVASGHSNRAAAPPSRSLGQILARNTFTWLNLLFALLGAASLATGSFPDATFLVIAVVNTVVGAVQEVRAKRVLDALAVVNAPKVRAIRDGSRLELPVEDVVLDDLIELSPGDQVVADAVVVADHAEVDEALATGESDPVPKAPGDSLLSGSWVVSGTLRAVVVAVGAESYAGRLATEARRFSLTGSELMGGINRILRWLSVAMVVIAPVLFFRQLQVQAWRPAIRSTVAGLVGMIPEGLVLLTTLAFLTAALRLGARRVLVQELPAVEGLARVDSLCTDKTGTLTAGQMEWGGLVLAGQRTDEGSGCPGDGEGSDIAGRTARVAEIPAALAALSAAQPANATLMAVRQGGGADPGWEEVRVVPFSSARKWSGATFVGHGTWVLGAPEMVKGADPNRLLDKAGELAARGARVLVLASGREPIMDTSLPSGLQLVAVVHLRERLRPDAAATVAYFGHQGVKVRVLSGDSAVTAGAVAGQVGLPGADRPVDARTWPADLDQRDELIEGHTVFGRVTPDQKREMVDSLRRRGHVIAMTGDGVNDTLALKDADLGIAMGSGSAVARGVAQLVLLDNQFSVLPSVVSEGRRVLHNIEAVAALFLVKNVYSIVISVVVAIFGWPYPFLPRHLTLISGLAIGIPGFFLALAPSEERFQPGFVRRVVGFAGLAGTVTSAAVLLSYAAAREQSSAPAPARTTAVLVTIVVSLWVLALAARPLRMWKLALIAGVASAFVGAFLTPGINTFFSVERWPSAPVALQGVGFGIGACAVIAAGVAIRDRHSARPEPNPS